MILAKCIFVTSNTCVVLLYCVVKVCGTVGLSSVAFSSSASFCLDSSQIPKTLTYFVQILHGSLLLIIIVLFPLSSKM